MHPFFFLPCSLVSTFTGLKSTVANSAMVIVFIKNAVSCQYLLEANPRFRFILYNLGYIRCSMTKPANSNLQCCPIMNGYTCKYIYIYIFYWNNTLQYQRCLWCRWMLSPISRHIWDHASTAFLVFFCQFLVWLVRECLDFCWHWDNMELEETAESALWSGMISENMPPTSVKVSLELVRL